MTREATRAGGATVRTTVVARGMWRALWGPWAEETYHRRHPTALAILVANAKRKETSPHLNPYPHVGW